MQSHLTAIQAHLENMPASDVDLTAAFLLRCCPGPPVIRSKKPRLRSRGLGCSRMLWWRRSAALHHQR